MISIETSGDDISLVALRLLALLSLVFCFSFGCGREIETATSTTVPAITAITSIIKLSVSGNRIINSSGEAVILRGATIEDPYFLDVISGNFNESLFQEMAQNWKMTLVRVPIHPPLFFKKGADYYCSTYLDKIVEWGKKYNFYIVLGWQAHGNALTGINETVPNPNPFA